MKTDGHIPLQLFVPPDFKHFENGIAEFLTQYYLLNVNHNIFLLAYIHSSRKTLNKSILHLLLPCDSP